MSSQAVLMFSIKTHSAKKNPRSAKCHGAAKVVKIQSLSSKIFQLTLLVSWR